MRLVATTITEIFPRDENLDLAKQEEILRNHYLYKALIPVPVGEDMSFFEEHEAAIMRTASQNSICDIIMSDVPGQVMEVVEHILHFVSDTGLHYAFPAEWGISKDSEVAIAMNEAIEKGYYEIEQYDEIEDEEENFRVLIQEFAYWAISTNWDLQEVYGPAVSWVWAMGMIPSRLTRPTVGLIPTTPLTPAGQTSDPSVSVPMATTDGPAANDHQSHKTTIVYCVRTF